ncbi:DUF1850 domain-containing protein [Microaceticoccus formicicus]|uniref:DUF1850 domain-containing protein n=1 Tax=Microaceticoccus formicicus TaxID=3118105 RepID=UPI003CD03DE1|nr:DUF1850 domain-containing protein [Peptoniphilaceae bacterium AMB_02]
MDNNKEEVRSFPPSSYFLFILVILIALAVLILTPVKILVAENFESKEILTFWKIREDDDLAISYTHSVERTEVSEWYKVKNSKLVLMEEHFSSYGAGLPADNTYPFKITDKGFVIYDINKPMDEVIYRTGAVRANHRLKINNEDVAFVSFSKAREAVCFKIMDINLMRYLIGRCRN